MFQILRILIIAGVGINIGYCTGVCHPDINPNLPQFVIGYGSLMQDISKRINDYKASDNKPINLLGFHRGFIARGTGLGFSLTYLGVQPQKDAKINAIYFRLSFPGAIHDYDAREKGYCRVKVAMENILPLSLPTLLQGEYWIYTINNAQIPDINHPIVQSYVDIFLSGCLQLEEKYHLVNFAQNCIKSTANWSKFWVNDRIHPRRANNQPYIANIDRMINTELPEYFNSIKLE